MIYSHFCVMTQRDVNQVSKLKAVPRCILVVDDEVLIRFAIADYLRECGYHIIEAADAAEAVQLLEANVGMVDLVFSDVQMPGEIDGFGLARWVRTHRPGLPVILTSGNLRTAELSEDLCEIGPVEEKPYDSASLAQRMKALMATT